MLGHSGQSSKKDNMGVRALVSGEAYAAVSRRSMYGQRNHRLRRQ